MSETSDQSPEPQPELEPESEPEPEPAPPVVEYKSPELDVPTSDEIEAAKWYTIGFLIVLGVFTLGAIAIMIRLAIYLFTPGA